VYYLRHETTAGKVILSDQPGGKLTGRIADHALEPFEKLAAYDPSREDPRQGAALICRMFVSKGVTSACDARGDPSTVQAAQDARDAGLLKVRLYNHIGAGGQWVYES
jgi:predicted amidohydrolase YtcJ